MLARVFFGFGLSNPGTPNPMVFFRKHLTVSYKTSGPGLQAFLPYFVGVVKIRKSHSLVPWYQVPGTVPGSNLLLYCYCCRSTGIFSLSHRFVTTELVSRHVGSRISPGTGCGGCRRVVTKIPCAEHPYLVTRTCSCYNFLSWDNQWEPPA